MIQTSSHPLRALVACALVAAPATLLAATIPGPAEARPAVELAPPSAPATATIENSDSTPTSQPEAAPAAPLRFAELPNFHQVDEKLYRGGEPKAGGIARLKELGIGTILDLRWEKQKQRAEQAEAERHGLRYVSLPMYGLVRPSEAKIARALAIIEDPANGPVFVHCERGSDRTGVIVACYRVKAMHWSAKRANDEAMGLGMYRTEAAKRAFVRAFSAKLAG